MFLESLEDRRVMAGLPPTISLGSGGAGGWELDPTFSTDGRVNTDFGSSGFEVVWDVAVQGDGKIVAVGQADGAGFMPDFAIARYNADGSLDASFGSGGLVTIDFGSGGEDVAKGVAIQPDGKIVVAGYTQAGVLVFATARLNSDGSLDTSFSDDGMVTSNFGLLGDMGEDVALQADGKILVVGTIDGSQGVGVARYDASGNLDITFDGDGQREIDLVGGFTNEEAEGILVQPDQQIVLLTTVFSAVSEVGVVRLNADGSDDLSFSGDGSYIATLPSAAGGEGQSLALQTDGSVVAVGTFFGDSTGNDLFLLRLDSAGTFDTLVTTDLGGGERGLDVAIQADGKIVVGGSGDFESGLDDFLAVRYLADGTLDTTFGSDGAIYVDFAADSDLAFAMALDAAENIVLAGQASSSATGPDFGLARLALTSGGPPPVFVVEEGGSVTLTGTYTDPDGGPSDVPTIDINWGDGTTTSATVDHANKTFTATHTYLDDVPTATPSDVNTIVATITDVQGNTASAATSATVNNLDPVAGPLSGPDAGVQQQDGTFSGVRGQSLSFAATFSDAGVLDTHQVSWDFGDGVVIPFHASDDAGALTPSHAYANSGTYTLTFTVRDDDGGLSTATATVTIVAAQIQSDPCEPGETALVVGGTESGEDIVVSLASGGVQVTIDSVLLGTFNPSHSVIVHAGGGNDDVQIAGTIGLNAWLYGGQGDDRLKGGGGDDAVLGQEGADLLVGGGGRDILIGGLGTDRIVGNSDDDILIAGTTDHDDDQTALCHLLAEWSSSNEYLVRVANLTGINPLPGENGSYFLNDDTVHDDNERDLLTGSSGQDWFFANLSTLLCDDATTRDKITDLSWWEFAADIDFIES